jgi:hypothetical protein
MARRTFDLDISEILIHWYAGRSQSGIAAKRDAHVALGDLLAQRLAERAVAVLGQVVDAAALARHPATAHRANAGCDRRVGAQEAQSGMICVRSPPPSASSISVISDPLRPGQPLQPSGSPPHAPDLPDNPAPNRNSRRSVRPNHLTTLTANAPAAGWLIVRSLGVQNWSIWTLADD